MLTQPRPASGSTACPASRPYSWAREWKRWRAPRRTRPATPGRNARGLHGGPRPATPNWPASTARGLHSGPARSRLTDAKHPQVCCQALGVVSPAVPGWGGSPAGLVVVVVVELLLPGGEPVEQRGAGTWYTASRYCRSPHPTAEEER